ncbi:MAG: hypothetical protein IJV15_00040 [Lachnospiraceae bacterium]|nr:hypothetical protein [Lachnospiraceae bacterium]
MNDNCENIVDNANLWAENQQLKEKLLNEQREYEGLHKVLNKKEEEWEKFLYNQGVEKSKLQSNWNSLFEYAKQQLEKSFDKVEQDTWEEVLDKMNELEGKDKE